MYENNFWYLFDVKKLTSLNYDNLKRYYVNFKGFLKSDNFFDLDSIDLFSDLKVFFTKKKKKRQRQIYLILSRNVIVLNTSIAYRILLIILVTVASV